MIEHRPHVRVWTAVLGASALLFLFWIISFPTTDLEMIVFTAAHALGMAILIALLLIATRIAWSR